MEAAKQDPSGKHPEYAMHAFSFDRYKAVVIKKDWNAMADIIVESIKKLQSMGADFIIIPSNTPHYGFKRIEEKSPLPVLNLIEITAEECCKYGYKKAAVLGTIATMKNGLYAEPLIKKGITPIIPNEALCKRIDDLIMNHIIPSKIDLKEVDEIAKELKDLDCGVFILGCTELPVVHNENNLGKPVIDTTRLLASTALEFAKNLATRA